MYELTGGAIWLAEHDRLVENASILVENGTIREVVVDPTGRLSAEAERIDCSGLTLLPGLIDCHVHVTSGIPRENAHQPNSLIGARAVRAMEQMLQRGFTTVRDCGGADLGLVRAQEEGTIIGPRLVICGKALSQSGGHGDSRPATDERETGYFKNRLGASSRICDGEAEVRKAAREEIKGGAKFIKIMAGGGVASPNDPIHFLGFSRNEIAAAVEEATNAGLYVSAHVYTDEQIRRVVDLGVRSIEHCNLITAETAAFMKEKGAMACPTLITLAGYLDQGASLGIPADSIRKAETVCEAAFVAVDRLRTAGVEMAYGTDLTVKGLQHRQCEEFRLRARVLPNREIIAAATTAGAKLLGMDRKLGVLAADAFADIIAVRGNPLEDIEVLAQPEKHLSMVISEGRVVKRLH